ncbi:MAG: Rrf2 family transcriptional regulator [Bacteroidetes bacterium]|nr:Rrf2 family transcriptional regulator [Bacteroidota bacterium]
MANIINFSDAASIGLHSMILIAKSDKPINAIQLSKALGNSKHHIGKVLQRLVKDGFLSSFRGPTGGFSLEIDPKTITLYDIYVSIEGKSKVKLCPDDNHICPVDKCIKKKVVKRLSDEFVSYMESQKLVDYL